MHSAKAEVVHALNHLANKIETAAVKIVDSKKMVAWGKLRRSLYSEDLAKTRLSARINPYAKLSKKQQRLADRYHSLAWRIAVKMKHREVKPRRFLLDAILATLKKELS